jgi:hypothetical protein
MDDLFVHNDPIHRVSTSQGSRVTRPSSARGPRSKADDRANHIVVERAPLIISPEPSRENEEEEERGLFFGAPDNISPKYRIIKEPKQRGISRSPHRNPRRTPSSDCPLIDGGGGRDRDSESESSNMLPRRIPSFSDRLYDKLHDVVHKVLTPRDHVKAVTTSDEAGGGGGGGGGDGGGGTHRGRGGGRSGWLRLLSWMKGP